MAVIQVNPNFHTIGGKSVIRGLGPEEKMRRVVKVLKNYFKGGGV